MKKCNTCFNILPLDYYYASSKRLDRPNDKCKICINAPTVDISRPKCADCGTQPSIIDSKYCRVCLNRLRRTQYVSVKKIKSPEEIENQKRLKRKRAMDRYISRRANNPELFKKRDREAKARRRAADPLFKLRSNIGTLITNYMSRSGYKKSSRTFEILGCSYKDFEKHIESQFAPGMSWDNRDKWHLDHRVPCSVAENEQELLRLNRWDNFQPLWINDNTSKAASVDNSDFIYHEILNMRTQQNTPI